MWLRGWKDTVDDYKNISIKDFYKWRYIEKGYWKGTLNFSRAWRPTGSIFFIVNIGEEDYIQVIFTSTDTTNWNKKELNYKIKLDKTWSNYGWYRYWFLCPCTGRRCTKLYLQSNWWFCDRKAMNLCYSAQLESRPLRGFTFWWYPYLEELYKSIKYKYRNGKPTKKFARYLRLSWKLDLAMHLMAENMRSSKLYKKYGIV